MAIKNQIQFRRGSSSDWIAISGGNGPTLYAGEPGFDSTNNILKIGDGSTNWLNLKPILNINGAGATNNQYLIYNSTTGLWSPTSSGIFEGVDISSASSGATLLSIEGTNGNLFSVVDSVSGSL